MKTTMPTPPPAPTPVDPGKSAVDYINAMADPALQDKLFQSESTYRPQYTALNLADMESYMNGVNGQRGALDMFAEGTARSQQIQSAANTAQRQADIADVMALGPAAAEAFRRANPELTQQLQRAGALQNQADPFQSLKGAIDQQQAVGRGQLGEQLYQRAVNTPEMGAVGQQLQGRAAQLAQSTGQLTPDEIRQSQQAVREAYGSQGRGLDSAAVSGEALSRLTNQRQRMQEDLAMASGLNTAGIGERMANNGFSQGIYGQDLARQQQGIANQGMLGQLQAGQLGADRNYALQLAQAQAALASDPFQAILGRTSGALQYGAGQQGFAGNMTQSMQGPQLFNPDAGINLALQNNANQTGYNNAVYGAQAGVAGANAGAKGQIIGAGIGAGVSMAGGALIGAGKVLFMCVPDGEMIDTPTGPQSIASLRAGDMVIGYTGKATKILQKHEYSENPEAERFHRLSFDNGKSLAVCDMHRVAGIRSANLRIGDSFGDATITGVHVFGGVNRSYDLLTADGGYRMAGVPVNSMIGEMADMVLYIAKEGF